MTPTRRRWMLNYYITQCTGNSSSWRSDELEIRGGRENQHAAERAPRPPVEQPRRTEKKHCFGHKSEGQYVAVLFGLQLPLTHNTFNKVRGIFL